MTPRKNCDTLKSNEEGGRFKNRSPKSLPKGRGPKPPPLPYQNWASELVIGGNMAFAGGTVVKVTAKLNWGTTGPSIQNVFHFNCVSGSGTDEEAGSDLTQFLETFYNEFTDAIANDVVFTEVDLYNQETENPMGVFPWPGLSTGDSITEKMAPAVSGLMTFGTGLSRVLGRKYIGGLTDGYNGDGELDGSLVALLANGAALLLEGFIGAESGAAWVPGVLRAAGGFASFISAVVRDNYAYQRRRKPGVGI